MSPLASLLVDLLALGEPSADWRASWGAPCGWLGAWEAEGSFLHLGRVARVAGWGESVDAVGAAEEPERCATLRDILPRPPILEHLSATAAAVRSVWPGEMSVPDFVSAAAWLAQARARGGADPLAVAWQATSSPRELTRIAEIVAWDPELELGLRCAAAPAESSRTAWMREACAAIRAGARGVPTLGDLRQANDARRCADESVPFLADFVERATAG